MPNIKTYGPIYIFALAMLTLFAFGYWYSERFGLEEEKMILQEQNIFVNSLDQLPNSTIIKTDAAVFKPNLVILVREYATTSESQEVKLYFEQQLVKRGFALVKENIKSHRFVNSIEDYFCSPKFFMTVARPNHDSQSPNSVNQSYTYYVTMHWEHTNRDGRWQHAIECES